MSKDKPSAIGAIIIILSAPLANIAFVGETIPPSIQSRSKGADSIIIIAPIADGLGMMPGAFDDAKLLSIAFVGETIPPSIQSRLFKRICGQMPGTAPLAVTASSRGDIVYTRPSRVDLTKRKQAIRQRLGDVGWHDNLEITATRPTINAFCHNR
jgi:hypothetical protein